MNFHVGRGRLNMCKIPWRDDLIPMEGHVALGTNRSPRNAWLWVRGPYNLAFNSAKNAEPFIYTLGFLEWTERPMTFKIWSCSRVYQQMCRWTVVSPINCGSFLQLFPSNSRFPHLQWYRRRSHAATWCLPVLRAPLPPGPPNDHMIYSDGGLFKQNLSYQTIFSDSMIDKPPSE